MVLHGNWEEFCLSRLCCYPFDAEVTSCYGSHICPRGEGGAFFWLAVPLPSGLLQFGESDKHFVYICHKKSIRCERSLPHLNLTRLHNRTFAQTLRFGDCVLELIVVAGNMVCMQSIVNALLCAELYLPPNLYFRILIPSTSEYDCVWRQILQRAN